MSLWRAATTVGALTGVSRIVGFIRDVVTAALLGAGSGADAYFIALRLPDLARRLLAEGAFSAAFAPRFAGLLATEGRMAALRFAEDCLAALLGVSILAISVGLWAMPALVELLAPGFDDGGATLDFCRLTFPYLAPVAVVALCGAVLNGLGRMSAFAASPIVFNLGVLAAAAVAVALPGEVAGYVLAAGVTLAGGLQVIWMLSALGRIGVRLQLRSPRLTPDVRRLAVSLGPGALAVGVGQINLTVGMALASLAPAGAVAALGYADRLTQLPVGVVGLALGMALLPRLAGLGAGGDAEGFAAELRQGALAALGLGLPAAVGLILLADPIVQILFVRGAFTPADAALTADVVAAFAIGIPAAVLVKALAAGRFARNDLRTPVRAAFASGVANLLAGLALAGPLGATGVALAASFAAFVNLAWLAAGTGAGGLRALRGLGAPCAVILGASAGMGWAVWRLSDSVGDGVGGLTILLAAGVATYGVLLAGGGWGLQRLKRARS